MPTNLNEQAEVAMTDPRDTCVCGYLLVRSICPYHRCDENKRTAAERPTPEPAHETV